MKNYRKTRKHYVSRQAVFTLITLFMVSFISANLGTHKQGVDYNILINSNQSDLNITVVYPNSTIAVDNQVMGKSSFVFNYTFTSTNVLGEYRIFYCSASGVCANDTFEVTGTGFEFNLPRAVLSIGLLALLVMLFVVNVSVIPFLPSGNNRDEEGILMSINQLKYLRPVLYATAYLILASILYTGSNIAFAYMGTELLAKLLYNTSYIMLILIIPMIFVWMAYIWANLMKDLKLKRYLDRGIVGEDL